MSVSLLLPYWDRQPAADKALALLASTYRDMDIEALVVDDGGPSPFVAPDVDLDVRVIQLPAKPGPGAISRALNAGAREARHDILGISAVEVLHERPVLQRMLDELAAIGPMGYVLAAAWCPEKARWQCHSTVPVPTCPPGTGPAFLGLMHRSLYVAAGGFDEDYCDGAGWEDKDFIQRLVAVGAEFRILDECVVTHPKTGARIRWPLGDLERNRRLYESKWRH